MKRFTLYEDTGSVTSHGTELDYKPVPATKWETFKLLALIPLTLLALAFAIWYFTHQEQDSYEFETHSEIQSK